MSKLFLSFPSFILIERVYLLFLSFCCPIIALRPGINRLPALGHENKNFFLEKRKYFHFGCEYNCKIECWVKLSLNCNWSSSQLEICNFTKRFFLFIEWKENSKATSADLPWPTESWRSGWSWWRARWPPCPRTWRRGSSCWSHCCPATRRRSSPGRHQYSAESENEHHK